MKKLQTVDQLTELVKPRRVLETEEEAFECKSHERACKGKKRALETEQEALERKSHDRACKIPMHQLYHRLSMVHATGVLERMERRL